MRRLIAALTSPGPDPAAPATSPVRTRTMRSPLSLNRQSEPPATLTAGFVTGVVTMQDNQPEESRVTQATDYLHLSSLIGACARMHVLAHRYDVTIHNRVTGAHRVMWAMGRAVETHIRSAFVKGMDWRGVYGRWRCACGKRRVDGFLPAGGPSAQRCVVCGSGTEVYEEMTWKDEGARIVGNPDLTFQTSEGLTVVEIKSLNGDEFETLTAPKPDHVLQALGYRRLIAGNGVAVAPRAAIVYANKKFQFRGSVYKEFHVSETQATANALDLMWGTALAIWTGKQSGTAVTPVRLPACSSMGTPTAKRCPTCTYCFSI